MAQVGDGVAEEPEDLAAGSEDFFRGGWVAEDVGDPSSFLLVE